MENYREEWENIEELKVTTGREKMLCELLMNWREHVAKIVDEPTWNVISFPQLVSIAVKKPASIMEVQ